MSKLTVEKYREKHKRCRTCQYVSRNNYGWYCLAKGTFHGGNVGHYVIKGCFCKLYKAEAVKR